MIADRLERLTGRRVIVADDEHLGGLADLVAIALGRDAFCFDALPHRTAEGLRRLFAQLGNVTCPAQCIAQRRDLGLPCPCAGRAREVHANRAFVLSGQGIALCRQVDVARRFGRNSGAIVGGEHAAQKAHAASISSGHGGSG